MPDVSPQPITIPTLSRVGLQSQAHKKAVSITVKEVKKMLGIPENNSLPSGIKKEIEESIKRAEDKKIRKQVENFSSKAIAGFVAVDSKQKLADVAKLAKETAVAIYNNADYLKSLEETAKMMKAKYDAYVKAGFDATQSFKLLEVELLSKRSR